MPIGRKRRGTGFQYPGPIPGGRQGGLGPFPGRRPGQGGLTPPPSTGPIQKRLPDTLPGGPGFETGYEFVDTLPEGPLPPTRQRPPQGMGGPPGSSPGPGMHWARGQGGRGKTGFVMPEGTLSGPGKKKIRGAPPIPLPGGGFQVPPSGTPREKPKTGIPPVYYRTADSTTTNDAPPPEGEEGDTLPTFDEWGRDPSDPRYGLDPKLHTITGKRGKTHGIDDTKKSGVPFGFHKDPETGEVVPNEGYAPNPAYKPGQEPPPEGTTPPPSDGTPPPEGDTTTSAPKGYGANAKGPGNYKGPGKLKKLPMWQNLNTKQQKALSRWFRNEQQGGGGGAALDQLFSSSLAPQTLYSIAQNNGLDFGKLLADVGPSLTGGSLSSVGHAGEGAWKWQNDPKAVQAMANQLGPQGMHWSMAEQLFPGQDFGGPPGGAPTEGQTGYNPLQGQQMQALIDALGPGFQFAPWAGQFYNFNEDPDWRGQ